MRKLPFYIAAAVSMIACSGSDQAEEPTAGNFDINEYEKLELTDIEAKVLTSASAEVLETHIKNGIRINVNNIWYYDDVAWPEPTSMPSSDGAGDPAPAPTMAEDGGAPESDGAGDQSSDNFSVTNTHIAGVDEADIIKYDGNHIFVIRPQTQFDTNENSESTIRILSTDATNASVTEVATIAQPSDQWGSISELYLVGDENATQELVTLKSTSHYYSTGQPTIEPFFDYWAPPQENTIDITSYDIQDASSPALTMSLEIDGRLHTSRKIDNMLYLVTQFTPSIEGASPNVYSEEDAVANEAAIAEASLAELLPRYRLNGEESALIAQADDCFLPVDINANQGFHNIVSLVAIDLEGQQITSARCLNTRISGIYANENELYVGGSRHQSPGTDGLYDSVTVVHKFELGEEINYRSTGFVPGTLNWRDPAFSMDAHNDALRIVTTSFNSQGPQHQLNILQDDSASDEMTIIATLPNDEQPAPIGKPNEQIYAVRFMQDRAFIVTFQQIDPLYVIDLTDHNPSIAGELEVPGFSTYLHPVDDDYLIGIGQEADENGMTQGVKISLFDISDSSMPLLVNSHSFGEQGSSSLALNDLRAVSFLRADDDQLRFALPIQRTSDRWEWADDALYQFEVNGLATDSVDLNYVGRIISESVEDTDPNGAQLIWPVHSGFDRSVLHGESLFYSHGGQIWASFWDSPDAATGPH